MLSAIESIGSSTRIEGSRLTDKEVAALLDGLGKHSFRSRDEQEVAGYAKVLETVFESYAKISLTENHIKQLHGQLLKYAEKDQRRRGEYKKLPNPIQALDAAGNGVGIIFETARPFETPRRMQALVAWARQALEEGKQHRLLVIGAFVLHFFWQFTPFKMATAA